MTVNLAQELAGDQRLGSSCLLCVFIREQPLVSGGSIPTQEEWHTELAKPANVVSHMSVVRALAKRGLVLGESSVKRHRRNHA